MAVFSRRKQVKDKPRSSPTETKDGLASQLANIQCHAEVSLGKVRKQNEDTVFAMNARSLNPALQTSYGLFVVADGMGGHENGEVASSAAVGAAVGVLERQLFEPLRMNGSLPAAQEVQDALNRAAESAQEAVLGSAPGGGTTLSAALVLNRQLFWAHVGDSRIYLYSSRKGLETLTTDHTVVRRLVELGQISAEEAEKNPLRNQLFRALGQGDAFRVDLGQRELDLPCALLLCSDGLWGLVPEETLLKTLEKGQPAPLSAKNLIDAANRAGGTDNISVIIANIS
ncbi:MAG TPA: protein phosphatase 2C domain-containing protein [Anaerolineaceae bacterium]|nr:protein phosphatase 2C domain-containing protein [Anaerolineaceae bacterium]